MRGGRPLVGRSRELADLERAFDASILGRGALMMLVGEPGIGKSRLSEELADAALRRGANVHIGRCWEVGGAPAFWPWVEVLRELIEGVAQPELGAMLGPTASDIAQLVPELAGRAGVTSVPPLAPIGERFRLFDAVNVLIQRRSTSAPLLLIFEDLHAADPPTLELLAFVSQRASRSRLLLLGTYRDVEARLAPGVAELLAKISRSATTIELKRLDRTSVAELVARSELLASDELIDRIYHTTEGNPLFVDEVMRLLEAQGGLQQSMPIPDGVRGAIGERLVRLGRDTRAILEVGAVVGREFTVGVVAEVSQLKRATVRQYLSDAARFGLVFEQIPGTYAFSHVLVRDVLYDELPEQRREELHLAIADVLEGTYGEDPAAPLAEIAHHLGLTGVASIDRALSAFRAASKKSMAMLAYEDAAALLERALALVDENTPGDLEQRFELMIEVGEARIRGGQANRAQEICYRAAGIARRLGSAELLARAALTLSGQLMFGLVDGRFVGLLREAVDALPPGDSAVRARLLARLGAALQPAFDPRGPIAMASDAVAMARRVASKEDLLAVLHSAGSALADLAAPEERLAIDRETMLLANELGDKSIAFRAHGRLFWDHLELANLEAADQSLRAHENLANEFRLPHVLWVPPMLRFTRALMEGRFQEAEQCFARAEAIAKKGEVTAADLYLGMAKVSAAIVKRDRAAIDSSLVAFPGAQFDPEGGDLGWTGLIGWCDAIAGRSISPDLLQLMRSSPIAFQGPANRVSVADMSAVAGDVELAQRAYDALQADIGRLSIFGMTGFAVEGPAERGAMVAAMVVDRWDDAERHHRSARELAVRTNMRPAIATIDLEYARGLAKRGRPEDAQKIAALARSAASIAKKLGMTDVTDGAEKISASLEPSLSIFAELGVDPPQAASHGGARSFGGGRYLVERELGRGGQKLVYLVRDQSLGRDCALSWIDSEELEVKDAERLELEARTLARMRPHPNVVTVFDIGREAGRPFVVTEFVEGGDLEAEMARGPLSIERCLQVTRGLLAGLIAVHGRGVVHRDLKPANVWLDEAGRPKLGDFGVAIVSDRSRLTMSGFVSGTADYAAPEQLMNQPIDGRTDLYSLGCMLYQLLTGRTPFVGPLTSQISQHLHAAPQPPSAHNPSIRPALDGFVLRLLGKRPDDRPANAQAALHELEALDRGDALGHMQAQKLASLGDLVAGIAHEINTPLGALQANVDVLQRAFGILSDALQDEELGDVLRRNERVARALATLERTRAVTPEATQRIARIVRNLKSFARLDQAVEESTDVRELIESALAVLEHDLGDRITVVRKLGEIPKIRCRPQELNQVLFNLLTNAIQSIADRGTITVSTHGGEGAIFVRISDTGVGIPKEHLPRIFDPGFTTKGVGVGVGLGLSIAYRAVHEHGGTISADSEVGVGSTFTVRLPLET